jgi:hypothetical protein
MEYAGKYQPWINFEKDVNQFYAKAQGRKVPERMRLRV